MKITSDHRHLSMTTRRGNKLLIVLVTASAWACASLAADLPADADLPTYLAWAEANHPALTAASAATEARREEARLRGAVPDLKLSWGEMVVPVETRVGPQQRILSVSQTLPWFGTLGARRTAAEAVADASEARTRERRLEVRRAVGEAWYRLALLEAEIISVAQHRDLAQQIEVFTRAAYEAGRGSYDAVLGAQMELGRLDTRLAGLRDRRRPLTVRLNTATGLPADTPTPRTDLPQSTELNGELPPEEILQSSLLADNPALVAQRQLMVGRRAGLTAATKGAAPNLTFGLDYIMTGPARQDGVPESGKDPVVARVSLSMPLWGGRADAEKKAAAGQLRAAGAEVMDLELRLRTRLEDLRFAWREAGRNLELYGTNLEPRGRQALAVVTAGYEAGTRDFAELLSARQNLLGFELALVRARAERALALNDLAALLGTPLTTLLTDGTTADEEMDR